MGDPPTPILLLKTKSSPSDPYHDLFTSTGEYEPVFVPVMEHRFIAGDKVGKYITDGEFCDRQTARAGEDVGSGRFGGVIITSQRAVESLAEVLEGVKETKKDIYEAFLSKTLIYVVGPATRNALIALGFSPSNILGEGSGNGGALAEFIIDDYKSTKDLLFLVGETHGTVIPHKLRDKEPKVDVEELVVYKTATMDSFESDFSKALDKLDETSSASVRWVIIFSPTGTGPALRVLEEREGKEEGGEKKVEYKICTIGPTTTDYMWQTYKKRLHGVAKSPSPQGLLDAITGELRVALEVTL